jgi:hypothetical protein
MRHLLLSLFTLIAFSLTNVFAQAPSRMSYQCVVRNNLGNLVVNSTIGIRVSVLQTSASGPSVYTETHSATTNANGLASIQIGAGVVVSGTFSSIAWGSASYFLKTETDPAGGTNYQISGVTQLLSVPYALYAAKTGDNYWTSNATGIYSNTSRVAIGTTPNPIVPLTLNESNPTGNGSAVLHLKSSDTWHTGLSMFNQTGSAEKEYSFFISGPANTGAVPGTFGLFSRQTNNWIYNVHPTTDFMAIGGTTPYYSKTPKSRLHVFGGDVNVDQIGSGIIMKSPNGNCWRVTIDNAGNFVSTAIACP